MAIEPRGLVIRPFRREDLPEILRLFHETVHTVCTGEYTPAQLNAWAPPIEQMDADAWERDLQESYALVAQLQGRLAGFGNLAEPDYVDRLYVGRDCQGQGVASALARQLEQRAVQLGAKKLTVHASLTACPFFERRGFRTLTRQTLERRGVNLDNLVMEKILSGQPEN